MACGHIPVFFVLTSASVHFSQVSILLFTFTSARVAYLYDLWTPPTTFLLIKYNDPDRDREIERLISKRVYELRPDRGSWRRETEGSAVSGGNDSEMAPQVPGIAQNGLGNGY